MLAVLVIVSTCWWGTDKFCYTRTEPMPIEVCQEWAKHYNKNKPFITNFAYCAEPKNDPHD